MSSDGHEMAGASKRALVIIPCHNDGAALAGVLPEAQRCVSADFLVIDDGSSDATSQIAQGAGAAVLRHEVARGYGGALISGFAWALQQGYASCATMDADGQHDPEVLPSMLARLAVADVVSGSRYHPASEVRGVPAPEHRRALNAELTAMINERFGWSLTDAFCGLKAYRASALARLRLSEVGYGFPLQQWAQVHLLGLRVEECPVPRIYLDADRTFGGGLDDAAVRRRRYLELFEHELATWPR